MYFRYSWVYQVGQFSWVHVIENPTQTCLRKKKNDNLLAYLIEIFKIMVPKVWFNRGLVSNANSEASPQIY